MDLATAGWAAACVFLGGSLKGVVGIGLPLVALPLLSLAMPLRDAVALLVVPIFATNLAQANSGVGLRSVLTRFWPVVVTLVICVALSSRALVLLPEKVLYAIVGAVFLIMTLLIRYQPRLAVPPAAERWAAPLVGALGGVLGGVTSLYGPPLMLYLSALRLKKDAFVPAIALLYLAGSTGLAAGLLAHGITSAGELMASALACAPVFAGLSLGQRLRSRLSEAGFETVVFVVYLATGASFLLRAVA